MLLELELERLSEQLAHVLLVAPGEGTARAPVPAVGGTAAIILKIWPCQPSGVQHASARRPPGFVTRAELACDRRVVGREHDAARRHARRRSSRRRTASSSASPTSNWTVTSSSAARSRAVSTRTGARSMSDDLRAALGGEDRERAGTGRRVEHAFARLRIASLDHERVDVANRVRDALVRPVTPDNALPRFQLCKGHRSSSRLDGLRAYDLAGASLPRMSDERVPVELHIVSDSTGETAQRLVLALEAQFPDQPFEEIRHPRVENVDDLHIAVQQARGRPAVMVYTLVAPELREAMRQLCRRARVHYCDLLGHPIDSISRVAGVAARMEPGARAPLDATYFKRIEAIEFAVKYDDGVGRGLDEADMVLVGVSRTSKTPLSIYLGYLGHKAANVPVVRDIAPPEELFEIDPAKIVGLTIGAERLADIRTARVKSMGAPRRRYAELEAVYSELEEATKLHKKLRCPVIDVSELSVEETAMRIIRLVERRRRSAARA